MKHILVVFLLLIGISCASAQEVYTSSGKPGNHKKSQKNKKKGYDPDRLILGGGINGLNYSNAIASAGISLIAGYRITDKLSAGVGAGYFYIQEAVTDIYTPSKPSYIRQYMWNPNVWARYFVIRNFFVSTTAEYNFIVKRSPQDRGGYNTVQRSSISNTAILVGAGFRIPLGGRVSALAEARIAVLQDPVNLYPPLTPMLNIGFAAGL